MAIMTQYRFEAPAQGGPGPAPIRREPPPPAREPMFNAPWPALALVGAIIAAYVWQSTQPIAMVAHALAFSPADLIAGRWRTLFTALFLHQGWTHCLMNAAMALAFATPVARLYGAGVRGGLTFFLFYLSCGALASLAFAALHWGESSLLVGASGAVSGLVGAAARIIAGRGRVGPILSRPVLAIGGSWVAINLLIAVIGGTLIPGADGAAIGWEAHIGGLFAGLFLAGVFARLAGAR